MKAGDSDIFGMGDDTLGVVLLALPLPFLFVPFTIYKPKIAPKLIPFGYLSDFMLVFPWLRFSF